MQNGSKPDGRCRHEVVGIEWNEARNQAKEWKRSVQHCIGKRGREVT